MNTKRNLKKRGSLLGSILLSLLVLVGSMPASADTQAQSQSSSTAAQSDTATQTATTAQSSTIDSTLLIPVSGTVAAADGTLITFSGNVLVSCSAVTNIAPIAPFVMLTFDCSGVTGTSGTGTSQRKYDTGGYQVSKLRDLQPSDSITVTVPVNLAGAGVTLAKAWQVTANLTFNTTTAKITSGTLSAAPAPALGSQ
jgi:Ca2+/Na+ antiporter